MAIDLKFGVLEAPKLGSSAKSSRNYSITFLLVSCSYHLAIDGRSFQLVYEHFPEVLDRLATRGAVFARMSPEQKQILVEHLQQIGYYVGKWPHKSLFRST